MRQDHSFNSHIPRDEPSKVGEEYRAIFDAAHDAIVVFDPETEIVLEANPRACEMYGLKRDELVGLSLKTVSRDVAKGQEMVARTLASEESLRFETVQYRVDGRELHLEVIASAIHFRGQKAILSLNRDVTESHHLRAQLEMSRAREQTILEGLPVAVYVARTPDPQDATWMSSSVKRFTGFPPESFMEIPDFWKDRIHPDDSQRVQQAFSSLQTRDEISVEYRWKISDGSYSWFLEKVNAHRRERGVTEMIGMFADVTSRKQTEIALSRSEARYRQLFERNLAGVYRSRMDGVIEECNEAFARIYGFDSPEEAMEASAHVLYPSHEERDGFIRELEQTGQLLNREGPGKRKDGTPLWLLENASLIRGEDGRSTHLEGVIVDITEKRRLEEQVQRASRLEALGRFAAGIAHDFNNLVSVMMGSAEIADLDPELTEKARLELDTIRTACVRAGELTQGLLAFSRRQVLKKEHLDLNDLIGRAMPMLRRMLPETVEISFRPCPAETCVHGDAGQLTQVLLNIAANAKDAMPQGGSLSLTLRRVSVDELFRRANSWASADRYVHLIIEDTGHGMNEATAANIFDPFFTTKEQTGGTGLGMASVFGIVEQHDGHIQVRSALEQGTRFDLFLPAIEARPESRVERTSARPLGRGEAVLVVDDREEICRVTAEILNAHGYWAETALNGVEALEWLAEHQAHLIVSDVDMPVMGGVELYQQVRRRGDTCRFLFFSGYGADDLAVLEPDPHTRFLAKPHSMRELLETVRNLLDLP